MLKRVCITISDERYEQILKYQTDLMLRRNKHVSFSKAVDLLTGRGLKK